MFGFVTIQKPELKIKEYSQYHAYYCGLCHTLRKRHGMMGQMTLTYDMTFLVLLLSSLYEPKTEYSEHHCVVHPVKKHGMLENEITEYASDMNIALAYLNLLDDWQDDKSKKAYMGKALIQNRYKQVLRQYPDKCNKINEQLLKLHEYEENKDYNLDHVSGCFGQLMGELFVYRKDEWEEHLRSMGFYLGKYIYLLDAYLDLEEDRKSGSYNPLLSICEREDYEEYCKSMLEMMIGDAALEFERLPCIQDAGIIRNILYGGVWNQYNKKSQEGDTK